MTVIGALSSFRELGEMSPHKRASRHRSDPGLQNLCDWKAQFYASQF